MFLEQHCALYILLLNMRKHFFLIHAFEKMGEMAHLLDVIEARKIIDVEKLLDFSN